MSVCEDDADDRRAQRLRGSEDRLRAAGDHRVDERETVVLLDEVAVDDAETADANSPTHGATVCLGMRLGSRSPERAAAEGGVDWPADVVEEEFPCARC